VSPIRICLLVILFSASGCSLFEPMVQLEAGRLAERELNTQEWHLAGAAEHNRERRKVLEGEIMSAPARPGAGLIGEVDVDKVAAKGQAVSGKKKGRKAPVRLEFTDTSLKDIIVVFLQEYLKQPYSFEDSFTDKKVNLYFHADATRDDMIALFDTLLENYGVRLRYSGGVYMVGAVDEKAVPVLGPSPLGIGDAVGVFQLNFLEAAGFVQLAKQVVKKPDKVTSLPNNVVVVSSTSTDVRAVSALLVDVDVPAFTNKKILVYVPRYLSSASLVAVLEAYQTQLSGPQAGTKQFEAKQILESEKVVIVAANAIARDLVLQFLAQTDIVNANQRRVYQYSLGTQTAVDLKVNLDLLIKASIKNHTEVTVVADKTSNSLFVYATPDEFAEIRKLLMRMDYRPPSVQIDVTIAEVNLTNNMQYGVEWYLKSTGNWLADVTTNLGAALPQLSAGVISPNNSYATLQLLGAETSFSLLSNPKIVVKNGATATINVGREQPIIQSKNINNNSAVGNTTIVPEYKKIGLTLEVTPFVTQENEVRMIIKVKDTAIVDYVILGGGGATGGDRYPVLANREVNTELVTGDGKTVFLGGIRKQDTTDGGSKVPGLGDMGYLGVPFRNRKMEDTGQELIILATPTIMLDQHGASLITNALLKSARREFSDPRKPPPVPAAEAPAAVTPGAIILPVIPPPGAPQPAAS
jgi:type II secretory pathway component GspD/PulD (secretin)